MRKVVVKGLKAQWQVPNADVIFANRVPFIRLRTQSWTLMQIILENNTDAPAGDRKAKGLSLACCNGLNMLVQIRNETQAAHFLPQGGSTLFDVDEVKKLKKARLSRIEIQGQRDDLIPISIDIPLDGITHSVQVLRPVMTKDALYVEYVASSLGVVLKYLRVHGFKEKEFRFQHQGPAGIQKKGSGYILVSKDQHGKKHQKKFKTLEAALQAQADVDAGGDGGLEDWMPEEEGVMHDWGDMVLERYQPEDDIVAEGDVVPEDE